jgi:hypothetical protein
MRAAARRVVLAAARGRDSRLPPDVETARDRLLAQARATYAAAAQ